MNRQDRQQMMQQYIITKSPDLSAADIASGLVDPVEQFTAVSPKSRGEKQNYGCTSTYDDDLKRLLFVMVAILITVYFVLPQLMRFFAHSPTYQ